MASAGDEVVNQQVQDHFVWLQFSILDALASGVELDVLFAPCDKCGSVFANVSCVTCWTLLRNHIPGTFLHVLLPGKCGNGLLFLKECDALCDRLCTIIRVEYGLVETSELPFQLRKVILGVCSGQVKIFENVFVELGSIHSREVHESWFGRKLSKLAMVLKSRKIPFCHC